MDHTGLDEFLTVADVAEMLKLNPQTVRNWIDQGTLPALRVGRRVRIKRSDLERLLAEGYTAGPASTGEDPGPSAEDFWGGEPVGVAEPVPFADTEPEEPGEHSAQAADAGGEHGGGVPRGVAAPESAD
jgi:excisionase family DNA binding protein